MTLLPAEPIRIGKGVEDQYTVTQQVCCMPTCNERNVERHHAVRRSYLAGVYDAVEIDGAVYPNVVHLCSYHHKKITDNEAKLVFGLGRYYWVEADNKNLLFPQPILGEQGAVAAPVDYWQNPATAGHAAGPLADHVHGRDDECPRCHGTGRLPHKEKLLNAPKRKYKTWSMGIPVDAGENGFEIWKTNLELCTEKIQDILGYSDDVPPYYVLIAVTADWLASEPQREVQQ